MRPGNTIWDQAAEVQGSALILTWSMNLNTFLTLLCLSFPTVTMGVMINVPNTKVALGIQQRASVYITLVTIIEGPGPWGEVAHNFGIDRAGSNPSSAASYVGARDFLACKVGPLTHTWRATGGHEECSGSVLSRAVT